MSEPNVMTIITAITAVVGAACGIAGLVLGVINTWREAQHNRVRLKVVPEWAFTDTVDGVTPFNFQVEVINLSEFPVVISEVGFTSRGNAHLVPTGCAIHNFRYSTALPCRLEPHASCTQFYLLEKGVLGDRTEFGKVNGAYARTQCGARVTGTSSALQQIVERVSGNEK
jgi:hypothetical protein